MRREGRIPTRSHSGKVIKSIQHTPVTPFHHNQVKRFDDEQEQEDPDFIRKTPTKKRTSTPITVSTPRGYRPRRSPPAQIDKNVTHLRKQVGWTEGLDTADIKKKEEDKRRRDEEWRIERQRKMREAEERRRTEWEAAMKMKEDIRRKRLEEEEKRRNRIEQERILEEAKRKEERLRWEASQAEKQERERQRWEEETLARMERERLRLEEIERENREREEAEARRQEKEHEEREEAARRELSSLRASFEAQQAAMEKRLENRLEEQREREEERRKLRAEKEEKARQLAIEREEVIRAELELQQEKLRLERERMEREWTSRVEEEEEEEEEVEIFHKGEAVEVAFEGGPYYYAATIEDFTRSENGVCLYSVVYENDAREYDVAQKYVRRPISMIDTIATTAATVTAVEKASTPTQKIIAARLLRGKQQQQQQQQHETPTAPTLSRFREFETPEIVTSTKEEDEEDDAGGESSESPKSRTHQSPMKLKKSEPTTNVRIGGFLWKIPRRTRAVPKLRWFRIETLKGGDNAIVWYEKEPTTTEPSSSKRRRLRLCNVFELRRGHSTDAFKGHIEYRGIDQLPPSRLCFSLVANTRTLDLAANDDVTMNRWLDRIGEMMARPRDVVVVTASPAAQEVMPRVSPSKADEKTKARWRRKMGKYVRKNHIAGVLTLLKEGCPVDIALETSQTADASVDTALLLSCQAGHDTMVRTLLRNGASVDPHPDVGGSALHCAVSGEHLSCVKAILEERIDSKHNLNDPILPSCDAPLHTASRGNNSDVVGVLLKHGALASQRNANGRTALHCACRWGRVHNVEAILSHSCVDTTTSEQVLSASDSEGNTPLHTAAIQGHRYIVQRLLEYGASALSLNNASQTPAQAAMRCNMQACAELLKTKQREEELSVVASVSRNSSSTNISPSKKNLFDGLIVADNNERIPTRVASSPSQFSRRNHSSSSSSNHTPRFYGLDRAKTDNNDHTTTNDEDWQLWEVAYTEEGHQYFYNRSTGESQWEDPRQQAEDEEEQCPDTVRDRHHPLVPHLRLGKLRKHF